MQNPYVSRPEYAFWRRSILKKTYHDTQLVTNIPFKLSNADRIASVGSCFAQHISRMLVREGFNYYVTESGPETSGACDEGYGIYPARFGNIYSVRQLLQLFERAYGLFSPRDSAWRRPDGQYVDPFRPQIQQAGFASIADLEQDRRSHLSAVRQMFEDSDVFIFTLGLTESWVSTDDGAVFPLAPGVVAEGTEGLGYGFYNFSVQEMVADLMTCFNYIRDINYHVKFLLTVSPVPLIATYEDRHVLLSTTYSKSALRVVCDEICRSLNNIAYFPSYEIITGVQNHGKYFAENLRDVTQEGVAHVMDIFKHHYLGDGSQQMPRLQEDAPPATASTLSAEMAVHLSSAVTDLQGVICDEEILDQIGGN